MDWFPPKVQLLLRTTPLHPQWLLESRVVPPEVASCKGLIVDVGAADRWLQRHVAPEATYLALDLRGVDGNPYGCPPDAYANAQALPLLDGSADLVVCFEVLEHVVDPGRAISEAARVLRTGGIYIVSMPFLYPLHDRPHDFRRCTPYGLRQVLADAGLTVEVMRPMMGSLETAGLLSALAVAGGLSGGGWRWILAPFAAVSILAINLATWLGSRIWPAWDGMAMGYEAVARKR